MTKLIYSDSRSNRIDQYLVSCNEAFKDGDINTLRTLYKEVEVIDFPRYRYFLLKCRGKLPGKEEPKYYILNIQGSKKKATVKGLIQQIEALKKLIGVEV